MLRIKIDHIKSDHIKSDRMKNVTDPPALGSVWEMLDSNPVPLPQEYCALHTVDISSKKKICFEIIFLKSTKTHHKVKILCIEKKF